MTAALTYLPLIGPFLLWLAYGLFCFAVGGCFRYQRGYDNGYRKGLADAEKGIKPRIIAATHKGVEAARRCLPTTTSKS